MLLLFAALLATAAPARTFVIHYTATVSPRAGEPVDVYFPLPARMPAQEVLAEKIDSPLSGKEETEPRFGNRYWHGHADKSDGKPFEVSLTAKVRRSEWTGPLKEPGPIEYTPEELSKLSKYLKADKRVPLGGGPIDKIDAELSQKLGDNAKDPAKAARAIYDYVVDNMEYKKVGQGWGNGDTFWACSAKYGNCTDFHALFLSLARRRGIPARFEMGFPVPEDKPQGKVGGYHCWVEFFLPGRGWVPIDASEAQKHPEQRERLFGGQPADRVELSEGRDLTLPGMKGEELNYFVYPHLELAGQDSKSFTWTFDYRDQPNG